MPGGALCGVARAFIGEALGRNERRSVRVRLAELLPLVVIDVDVLLLRARGADIVAPAYFEKEFTLRNPPPAGCSPRLRRSQLPVSIAAEHGAMRSSADGAECANVLSSGGRTSGTATFTSSVLASSSPMAATPRSARQRDRPRGTEPASVRGSPSNVRSLAALASVLNESLDFTGGR